MKKLENKVTEKQGETKLECNEETREQNYGGTKLESNAETKEESYREKGQKVTKKLRKKNTEKLEKILT